MRRNVALAVVTLLAPLAAAQDRKPDAKPPAEQDATPTAQPADDILSGPKVEETQAERSLVRRNFQGKVQRLDTNPAEAAAELLSLDASTRAKVKAILDKRAATLDKIVRDNLELLLKFQNTPDRRGKLALLRDAREVFKPLDADGKLQDQIAAALPKDQADRYKEILEGYWQTLVADAEQEARGGKDKATAAEIRAREVLLAFGTEIRRSYERQVASRVRELEDFLGKLGLPAEKEAKLRTMFAEFAERTKLKPTEQQRREFALKVLRELDREQQQKVLAEILGRPEEKPQGTPMEPEDEPMKEMTPAPR